MIHTGNSLSRVLPARIMITGAGGFVGRYLCDALAACNPPPTVVAPSFANELHSGTLDLTDAVAVDRFVAHQRPDALIHLAAQASVGAAQAGMAVQTWAVNLGGTLNLATAMARHVPESLVLFASSSEVYGRAFGTVPIDENTCPQPLNAYARSKLMAEQVLDAVLAPSTRLVVARPFNHTGPGQREDFVLPSFAGQIARIEAGLAPPMVHVGNLDAARDILDVHDVVEAYIALLAAPRLPSRSTFNIATGQARPLHEMLESLRAQARVPFRVEVDPERLRPSDVAFAAGRFDKLSAATGWTPKVDFDDMLSRLLDDARAKVFTVHGDTTGT